MVVMQPSRVLDQLVLRSGMKVADFGMGSGYYLEDLAARVGVAGRVYAFDIQKALVDRVRVDIEMGPWGKVITPLWADLEQSGSTGLQDSQVDVVLVWLTLFQARRPQNILREARRILKPGGTLAVVEWKDGCGGVGPQSRQLIDLEQLLAWAQGLGFLQFETLAAGRCLYGITLQLNDE